MLLEQVQRFILAEKYFGVRCTLKIHCSHSIADDYSSQWRSLVEDIYPPMFTDTEIKSCFSIFHTSEYLEELFCFLINRQKLARIDTFFP